MGIWAGLERAGRWRGMPSMPTGASVLAGLIASVCCGGSLLFVTVGLGAAYGALGLWRYVPEVLALGALTILAVNYVAFRGAAEKARWLDAAGQSQLRSRMLASAAFGLAAMAASFVVLEWLNHAVVQGHSFLALPEYGAAIVPGVPNLRLFTAGLTFGAIPLLWALPFPGAHQPGLPRAVAFAFTAALLILLVAATAGVFDTTGPVHPIAPTHSSRSHAVP